eukprot:CAMPEP_0201563854 /NCGR_PEP_ID=MMETSP0190_2-20130828/1377_1 /ASSEMBLY_ACC=CAM_ASM_000263 /TAXON_ID=37353 /ORGANISM="Rosalina sp." /LENGTH=31 /DNA_ID= /DNA_START= /DNA_END= /DNA_ORIENTATION=
METQMERIASADEDAEDCEDELEALQAAFDA